MAFASITAGSSNIDLSGRFGALLAAVRLSLRRRKVFRQTMRELNALSTRELADLGLSRSMITRIALEAAYGK